MTVQRDCPDTLASRRISELSDGQLYSLRHTWPAAHAAVRFMKLRIESHSLTKQDRAVMDETLFDLVRYHRQNSA